MTPPTPSRPLEGQCSEMCIRPKGHTNEHSTSYIEWSDAGGPVNCEHGYWVFFACPKCDWPEKFSKQSLSVELPALSPPPDCTECGHAAHSPFECAQTWPMETKVGEHELGLAYCGCEAIAPVAEVEEPAPRDEAEQAYRAATHDGAAEYITQRDAFTGGFEAGRAIREPAPSPEEPGLLHRVVDEAMRRYPGGVEGLPSIPAELRIAFVEGAKFVVPVEQPEQVEAGERNCVTCGHPEFNGSGQAVHIEEGGDGSDDWCLRCPVGERIHIFYPPTEPPVPSSGAGVHGPWQRDGSGLNPRWWRVRQSGQHEHVYVPAEVEAVIRVPLEARNETQKRTIQSYRARALAAEEQLAAVTAERDRLEGIVIDVRSYVNDPRANDLSWGEWLVNGIRAALRPPSTESMDQQEGE